MELRKLISKFLTSLVEKNYAQANDVLKEVVEEKIKQRVKASSDKLNRQKKLSDSKKEPYKRNKFKNSDNLNEGLNSKKDKAEDHDTDCEDNDSAPKNKKSKLSKEENKKRFLEMIAKKKKNSKKGNK
jgi:hypothetical protein